jgi:hypothetical protein
VITQVGTPRTGVEGLKMGDPTRLVPLPNPVPSPRVEVAVVEEFLRSVGVPPALFEAFLAAGSP